jgi:hypothetical protein
MSHLFVQGDVARIPLPDGSVDLVLGSPPYCNARTYGIGSQRKCAEWVDWMLGVTAEALRVSKGCVVWVAAGVTRKRNYWPACEGLMWQWWLRGGHAYRPCAWFKVDNQDGGCGTPGSGQDEWFRADWEYAMCFRRPGKLPWSDNTACGRPPRYKPGGAFRTRIQDGRRAHRHTKRKSDGSMERQVYDPPEISNPGNIVRARVGGGALGHKLAHDGEAPYPEDVPRFFIRSLCPPGGTVLDPFSGSGTTVSVALQEGRHAIGVDLRRSQAELGRRRLLTPATRPRVAPPPIKPLPGQLSFLDPVETARTP